MNIRWKFDIN
jgi:hypothetical protein